MNETHASVEEFDLDRHAVVEASAGTGKTYTIEVLVQRLITEIDVPIDEILIVTYTEKATGDLKRRLKQTLERSLLRSDEHRDQLQRALDHFDQAAIFTIHAFCQRLLQEYALEQGQDFQLTLVDDRELLQGVLRDVQRKTWRRHFGTHLKAVLERAGYHRGSAEAWERRVLEVAGRYKPRSGHQLRPTFVADWHLRLHDPAVNWAGQLEVFTILEMQAQLRASKRERGLLSFDDMIANVEESLDPERNPDAESLLATLRARYRYGIVDEFQDTDPLQWRIARRIFLDGGASRLFVVGDPKQAIFGFRNADLPAYLTAVKQMKEEFAANAYPLDVNWRSEPDLLEGLNCLFVDGEWFPPQSGIAYRPVHAPDEDKRLTRMAKDRTDRAALTVVDVTEWTELRNARKRYARFVAGEIKRLLDDRHGPRMTFQPRNEPERPIHAGDICILIMKRPEAEPILKALDAAGIAYNFYKQLGLWQSPEAFHVETLLHALANPDDPASLRKALLTCFFRIRPEELARCPDVPMQHPARQLFQNWIGFAESRAWSSLFASMVEDTGLLGLPLTPGPSPREGRGESINDENLRQMLGALEQAGHAANLDLLGLIDWLRRQREVRDARESSVQPAELQKPRVKIMTMHASKGLEFSIVFVAGGFTQGGQRGPTMYHDEQGRVVFDLCPDDAARAKVAGEAHAEHRRLLYVALTRPVFKLYIPKIKTRSKWRGPIGTVLMPALEKACLDRLSPLAADVVKVPLIAPPLSPDSEASTEAHPRHEPIRVKGTLFPPVDADLDRRRIVVRSFSSMTRHLVSAAGGSSFGESLPRGDNVAPASEGEDALRGAVFGDMVHTVLQHIDFAEVGRAARAEELILPGAPARLTIDAVVSANAAGLRTRLSREALEQACRVQIADLIWRGLRTPLGALGARLCDVAKTDRLHEIEFLFPATPSHPQPGGERGEEFITGYIDLLLRRGTKYYLVDFKTNLLPGYDAETIARAMDEADYHRQYRLYLQAAARWLARAHGPAFDFFDRFAGVYYLFMRGMNGADDSSGVYFHRPTARDLDLARALAQESNG